MSPFVLTQMEQKPEQDSEHKITNLEVQGEIKRMIQIKNKKKQTPLHLAADRGHDRCVVSRCFVYCILVHVYYCTTICKLDPF